MLWRRVTLSCFLHILIIHMIETVMEISEKLFKHLPLHFNGVLYMGIEEKPKEKLKDLLVW